MGDWNAIKISGGKEEILKERRKLKQQTLARRKAINLGKEADPVTDAHLPTRGTCCRGRNFIPLHGFLLCPGNAYEKQYRQRQRTHPGKGIKRHNKAT